MAKRPVCLISKGNGNVGSEVAVDRHRHAFEEI
jgi:hypothetical protein